MSSDFFLIKRRISIQNDKPPIRTILNRTAIKAVIEAEDGTATFWLQGEAPIMSTTKFDKIADFLSGDSDVK